MKPIIFSYSCLLFLAPSLWAADSRCTDRIKNLVAPELPKSTQAAHALARGACSVDVVFALSAGGIATVIGSGSSETRCEILEDSAKKAVESSEFSSGNSIDNCTIRITFETEERVPVALRKKVFQTLDNVQSDETLYSPLGVIQELAKGELGTRYVRL